MTWCMRPSRVLDNPAVLIVCSLHAVLSLWGGSSFLLFQHRQYIAGWVFKPRDLRTPAAENPLFVCHQVAFIVRLEMHALPGQVVYSLLNIGDRKIQNGESGWSMVFLRIHQDLRPASDMER